MLACMTQGAPITLSVTRLRIVYELANRETIAAVADALWMTPSAVSQQLTALERETQTKLTERRGRGVALTVAGRLLAEHSERVLAALDAAEAALQTFRSLPSGRLRVAAFPSVVAGAFPLLLTRLTELYPELAIEFSDLEGNQSLEEIRSSRLDLAIVDEFGLDVGPARTSLDVHPLDEDPLGVAHSTSHRFVNAESVGWSDLRDEMLVMEQSSSAFAAVVLSECRRAGFEPRLAGRLHDAGAVLALVETGHVVAVLPRLAVVGKPLTVSWRPLAPLVNRRLLAVSRAGRDNLPSTRAVLETLRSVLAELAGHREIAIR